MPKKKKEKKFGFVEDEKSSLSIYTKGVFIGSLSGFLVGVWLKKVALGIIGGGLLGGWVAHEVYNGKIKPFDSKNLTV